ncbi:MULTISPECIES: hypothetical protein [Pseudomonas]|uniref:Uncharacterized protein n=1 Tax=Pseudomonas putida (strain DOT-T1E) TaxID=1196325 RepID=I7CA95_PSEPT|nr:MULTISPECIES: hypothetical protein [Pseudomonas]AFO48749.1 hypothetical protein T1E_2910 [Pseudomonas putida DOT-T1E]MBH4412252.1 hypothetical protein [Pseudomonas aeruginosa]UZM92190.1 hypothetical protein OPZ46_20290 [Pseudomonas putida DOT-T1E]
MENLESNKLSAFTVEYNKAKIKPRNALWSKALLLSPLFSSSSTTVKVSLESNSDEASAKSQEIQHKHGLKNVAFSPNACTIVFNRDATSEYGTLIGTQYLKYTHYGYQLNMGLHYDFLSYMVEVLHMQYANWFGGNDFSPSTVTIDINSMIRHLGLDSKSKTFYKEVFYDLNCRLFHSSARLDLDNGSVINDRYVYKFEYNEDMSVFTTHFGDVFIDTICVDSWKQTIDYLSQRALKGNATKQLYMVIRALARPLAVKNSTQKVKVAEISVASAISTMSLTGSKKTNVESVNDAIKYLMKIGFIDKVVDDKQGGRSVVIKKLYLNQSFDLEEFALKSAGIAKQKASFDVEAEYEIVADARDDEPALPIAVSQSDFIVPEVPLTTEQHLAKIVMTMAKIGINPEALKASIPEQAVDVENSDSPAPAEIDPWNVVPDFDAWERESDNSHKPEQTPRKVWPDDEIYSQFD